MSAVRTAGTAEEFASPEASQPARSRGRRANRIRLDFHYMLSQQCCFTFSPALGPDDSVAYFRPSAKTPGSVPIDNAPPYRNDRLERFDLEGSLEQIDDRADFVLHGPSQEGKTSMLRALADRLNTDDADRCLCINLERTRTARSDVDSAIAAVFDELPRPARMLLSGDSLRALRD